MRARRRRWSPISVRGFEINEGMVLMAGEQMGWMAPAHGNATLVEVVEATTSEGSHPHGDYNDRPRSGQERLSGSRG